MMTDCPIGMWRYDELADILTGLSMTGGVDQRTLAIVAQATGIGDYYRQQVSQLSIPAVEIIRALQLAERIE